MQLTYRGQSYSFQSASPRIASIAGPLSRTLQYRGNTYTCQMSEPQPLPTPQAINWRYNIL